jgi:hypothetical protein
MARHSHDGGSIERPRQLGDRAFLTDDELKTREVQARQPAELIDRPFAQASGPARGGRAPNRRTSEDVVLRQRRGGPFNAPTDLSAYDRCITRGVIGSMMPFGYNAGNEIVQARDTSPCATR